MSAILDQILAVAEEAMAHPLALPISVGILTVLATVALFFSVGKSGQTKKRRRRSSKLEPVTGGGTTTVDGVRRSTRAHKTTSKYEIEEVITTPGPRKTPKKTSASKDAVTVSPKKRGRPAKSPAAAPTPAPAADSLPTTPRRRGRPRKSQ